MKKILVVALMIFAVQFAWAADATDVKFTADVAALINIQKADAYNPPKEGGVGYMVVTYQVRKACRLLTIMGENMSSDGVHLGPASLGQHERVRAGDKFEDRIVGLVYRRGHYILLNRGSCQ